MAQKWQKWNVNKTISIATSKFLFEAKPNPFEGQTNEVHLNLNLKIVIIINNL